MKNIILLLTIFYSMLSAPLLTATQQTSLPLTLSMNHVSVQDALHQFADAIPLNILISPSVQGTTTLQLNHVSPQKAFNLLLTSHALVKESLGNVWYITTQAEWMHQRQEQSKLRLLIEDTAPLVTHLFQIQYAKAEEIAHFLQDNTASLLSKRGHVRVDTRTNVLCIQDMAAQIPMLTHVIATLDVPVQQVVIDTRIASIDHDFERDLGIHFSERSPDQSDQKTSESTQNRYSFAILTLPGGSFLDMQLMAVENTGHGHLLSSPRLFTANQQTASIESGEEIPYQEISRSGATGVAFKKAVLRLEVTPQIMPNHHILLQLQLNQDKPSTHIILGVPAITTRQMNTHILIKNGQTVVLGGIYESNQEENLTGIPFLGKIPIIGGLFQTKNITNNKRELLIFVTPSIVT